MGVMGHPSLSSDRALPRPTRVPTGERVSHSHYVQFAHIPRTKFWSYVDIRGKTEKSWGLYVKFSQMYYE